jgi:hypothetical protein
MLPPPVSVIVALGERRSAVTGARSGRAHGAVGEGWCGADDPPGETIVCPWSGANGCIVSTVGRQKVNSGWNCGYPPLRSDGFGCRLSVGREVKMGIPAKCGKDSDNCSEENRI